MKYPVVKTAWILSFILSPMPAPLLYTGNRCGGNVRCSQRVEKNNKELSSLTRAPAANRKEAESRGGSRLGPLMVPVWGTLHVAVFPSGTVC